jgi:hypothetical protein
LVASAGRPTAYVQEDGVFLYCYRFVGNRGGDKVWHGLYIGEIVNGPAQARQRDRFRFRRPLDWIARAVEALWHDGTMPCVVLGPQP